MLILIFTASDSGVGHWLQMSFQGGEAQFQVKAAFLGVRWADRVQNSLPLTVRRRVCFPPA